MPYMKEHRMEQQHELDWPAGYRINPRVSIVSDDMIEAFRQFPASAVGDAMSRTVGTYGLRQYHPGLDVVMCGPAVTVRIRPGDNLMIHKALMMVQPGDVLIVDGGADDTQAVMGGLMRTTCIARQLAGVVVDGAIRDLAEWAEGGMPIYARAHTTRGPTKEGPGEINVPIVCAGLAVLPGDIIVGDADGIVAVPAADAERILRKTKAHLEREAAIREGNRTGTSDPERFDAVLRAKGLPV
ncbi:MAG TPA: RraA family protein [Pararobbsia sp.]|nr:RraA family protein [Pararobbsia sp.]